MTNCYSLGPRENFENVLRSHRRDLRATYCLFDYDFSCQFPLNSPLTSCRMGRNELPISDTPFNPPDLDLGQYDYNPFAYDVAGLGNLFKYYFGVRTFSRSPSSKPVFSPPL